ncbi:MAG TPA: transketolase [Kiritimatiellae bacterium]|nr:transketolase [Kiritimatiellia bacterium]
MSEQAVPQKTSVPLKPDCAFSVEDIRLAANTVRCLVADAVERAQSGHPGGPLGMADVAATLFLRHLKYWPDDPQWPDRDRFVLSAGHASALLYALLHLAGYRLNLEDLKNFRQVGSITPGHPEVGRTPGVETTTGPLGQGCGNGVGMALAEAILAQRFNRWGRKIVDHHIFVLASDGDMMEGISHEVFSLAGHLQLHKLILIYDSNRVTIEGPTALAWAEDIRQRFISYDWRVMEVDGHDIRAISEALSEARREAERPVLLITHTHIGWGAPHVQDAAASHGAPLGAAEVRLLKQNLGLPSDRQFHIPERVREIFALRRRALEPFYRSWKSEFRRLEQEEPEFQRQWKEFHSLTGPTRLEDALPRFSPGEEIATRKAAGAFLQVAAAHMPNLLGGSADLGPSNNTVIANAASIAPGDFSGRNIHFGVREHAMGAILNGMALHGGLRVYGGTFLVFADYLRPAIRMAALMKLPVIYVFTHDSIFVGEDGPTHQPVEQIVSLRIIPGLTTIRPADANEAVEAWRIALTRLTGPTALLLTRQKVPVLDRSRCAPAALTRKGAYVLWENQSPPELVILASGSEVNPSLAAGRILAGEGRRVRVVSFPSWELFDEQPHDYRRSVLGPEGALKVVVEAGRRTGWERYAGPEACFVTVEAFGLSGPWKCLRRKFGLDTGSILAAIRHRL